MEKEQKSKKEGNVKSFLKGLVNKLDKKMEEKAKQSKCCGGGGSSENKSCCG